MMNKKIIGFLVCMMLMSTVILSGGSPDSVETKKVEKNNSSKEAELTILPNDYAYVGSMLCTNDATHSASGDPLYIELDEREDVKVTWSEDHGSIHVLCCTDILTEKILHDKIADYEFGFYLQVYTKKGRPYPPKVSEEHKVHRRLGGMITDQRCWNLSVDVELDEKYFEKIDGMWKIECQIKGEVLGRIFGMLFARPLYDGDRDGIDVWISENVETGL